MENEKEVIVDNNEVEETEKVETTKEVDTTKVEKPKRTPQEELEYFEGRAQRIRKDLGLEKPKEETKSTKTGELDDTQLDYLDLKGYSENEDIKVIEDIVKKTGMTVRQALKDDYVISKLDSNKKARDAKKATPSSTKRSGESTDNEDYYFNKYEQDGVLPKNISQEMKQKLVNRKAGQTDARKNPFE